MVANRAIPSSGIFNLTTRPRGYWPLGLESSTSQTKLSFEIGTVESETTWTWFATVDHIRLPNGAKPIQCNIEHETRADENVHWFELNQQETVERPSKI